MVGYDRCGERKMCLTGLSIVGLMGISILYIFSPANNYRTIVVDLVLPDDGTCLPGSDDFLKSVEECSNNIIRYLIKWIQYGYNTAKCSFDPNSDPVENIF